MSHGGEPPIPNWSWDRLKYYIYKSQPIYNEKPVHGPGIKDTTGKHLPDGMRIPDWRKYHVSTTPELTEVQRRLAAMGLKNPWLRNEVWRFDRKMWLTPMDRYLLPFRTLKYGVAAFIVTEILFNTVWKEDEHDHHKEDKYKLLYEMEGGK